MKRSLKHQSDDQHAQHIAPSKKIKHEDAEEAQPTMFSTGGVIDLTSDSEDGRGEDDANRLIEIGDMNDRNAPLCLFPKSLMINPQIELDSDALSNQQSG